MTKTRITQARLTTLIFLKEQDLEVLTDEIALLKEIERDIEEKAKQLLTNN